MFMHGRLQNTSCFNAMSLSETRRSEKEWNEHQNYEWEFAASLSALHACICA